MFIRLDGISTSIFLSFRTPFSLSKYKMFLNGCYICTLQTTQNTFMHDKKYALIFFQIVAKESPNSVYNTLHSFLELKG